MTFSKQVHVGVTALLLTSTLAAGWAAYHYREHLLSANQVTLRQQTDILNLERELKNLDQWAPGIVRSIAIKRDGIAPRQDAKSYNPTGSYLGYKPQPAADGERVRFDKDGLPTRKYGDTFHYNPVTIAQYALQAYGGADGPTPQFPVAVNKLLSMQSPDGSFRYDFPFARYTTGEVYQPGWTSGMAQGQAMSVLARAYSKTGDQKLLEAGNRALNFMMLPFEQGGTATTLAHFPPERSNAPFIMEYPQDPPVYTLNGYMFSILGLYDWALITGSGEARRHAEEAIKTLKILLPYYDLGVVSAYDLSYITIPKLRNGNRRTPHVGNGYHTVHIELLWALHKLTGEPMLLEYADRWVSYAG